MIWYNSDVHFARDAFASSRGAFDMAKNDVRA